MRSRVTGVTAAVLALILASSAARAENADVEVVGHVYEPVPIAPDAARIAALELPDGFRIAKFAEVSNPRMLAVGADGSVYVTQREPGTLTLLRDADGDGVAEVQKVVAEKPMLHGVAVHRGRVFVATVEQVFVADIESDGTLGALDLLVEDLPDGGQHPNRTLGVGPDGMLYLSVGSTCNACTETADESAAMLRIDLETGTRTVFASGLRNTIGFGWHPATRALYGMDHGIDWLGDDEQKEELNEIREGARYGWPYVYADSKLNPQDDVPKPLGMTNADWAKGSVEPVLLYTAHSAPMQMAFYTGRMFPAEYTNDAFVAMRGSWNRKPASGYEVVRVRFDPRGKPTRIEPFVRGFLVAGAGADGADGQLARLAGVAVARDGALLVSDDSNDVIYRVAYGKERRAERDTDRGEIVSQRETVVKAPAKIELRSPAFGPGEAIPDRFSAYHEGESPPLEWSGVPPGAAALVLVVEDPDARSPKPYPHWLVADVPADAKGLPAALAHTPELPELGGARQGSTPTGRPGYYGPRPPAGEPAHHYHFQLFALDAPLRLPQGFNRHALLAAMEGHVLARGELVGTYQR